LDGALPQTPSGAYSAPPDPLAGFKGLTSKGREVRKDRKEGQERGGREERRWVRKEKAKACIMAVGGWTDAPDWQNKVDDVLQCPWRVYRAR